MSYRDVLRVSALVLTGLAVVACSRSSASHHPPAPEGPPGLVDQGQPVLQAASGYAGSATCRACHKQVFDAWAATLHNEYTRTTDRPGATGKAVVADADGNHVDDFRDGLDLSTDPDFAAYGANAPKLRYTAGATYPYSVEIAGVSYPVWRTLGGNGQWMQRYLTRLGSGVFVLPVQYDETTANWVPYDPGVWYANDGSPRFTTRAGAVSDIAPSSSYDLRCAGCHATAFRIQFDSAADRYVTGYRDATVGCEDCHGPAQAHVNAGGDPKLIQDPEDFLDGTAPSVKAADMVCARCHVRGKGDVPPGGADPTGYPSKAGSTFPVGNNDLPDWVTLSSTPSDYWRYKDNPLGLAPTPTDPSDDTYLASRNHHQQWNDFTIGTHAPNNGYDPTCFNCHDPHGSNQEHLIRSTLTTHGNTFTGITADNDKLCLSCHEGHGDFAGLSAADVQAITSTSAPDAVKTAVVDHMKDRAGMPVGVDAYDPVGTGVGRCITCHMPKMAHAGGQGKDAAGDTMGNLHDHTFQPVWPNISKLTGSESTNSCNQCHPTGPNDEAAAIIKQWVSDPDADGTFHADTPRNFQNGVANPYRDGGEACVACHTTPGFLEIQVESGDIHTLADGGSAAARTALIKESIRRDMGITCEACHGKGQDGKFGDDPNPLRFPVKELCGRCHNNQTVQFVDYRDHGEIVRHPQREMYEGIEGGQVPGVTYTNSPHTTFVGKACVGCHYNPNASGTHTFEPNVNACRVCHPGLESFDRPTTADWDGNGKIEGIQTEFDGCLKRLDDAIKNATTSTGAKITFDGEGWAIDGDESNTAALDPVKDEALLRAIFNDDWVRDDGSRGIHNTAYALELIQSSYEELTGQPWPGAKRQ